MVAACGLLITTSCKKTFFTDYNVNPNALDKVGPNLLLPTVEAAAAYTQGGDESRFTALLTQQMFGANSQSQTFYIYGLNPGSFDNLWPDLYTSTLENDYTLIKISDAGGYNTYGGIARIIMAYELQVAVDLWGDLPYSQALKGNDDTKSILHPAYDKAQVLYDSVAALIDAGTALLQAADPGALVPGTEDVIYGGDADKWIKFGHAIKARLAIHQSKGNAQMAATALQEAAKAFASAADNAQYIYGTTQTAANAWYQFYRDRPGDENWQQSPMAINMAANDDPRYPFINMDSTDKSGQTVTYYNKVNAPTELITYDEIQYLTAEAVLRNGGSFVAAQAFLTKAITENMKKLGVSDADAATYIAANGTLPTTSVDAAIAKIAQEEYIALFLNPEAFTLWRRTGQPALTSTTGNAIPRRLLYPQSELNFNAANVPSATLYAPKLFWDN
jgi:hypothetical protein